ncbi:hypothetical protein PR202_gb16219 [Eleusine coracana subsp. coracana]|uniref:Exocyst complex component Sec3 C-terminal domain-containing protein n=1 Tax=Eleusine coracana subsp. coracana TaxID=191504 RepID=A0AAV5EXL3_ELECO|nr:hypothetical protein PR202_gb16219 [Eleusine coracana subsp. coracana]
MTRYKLIVTMETHALKTTFGNFRGGKLFGRPSFAVVHRGSRDARRRRRGEGAREKGRAAGRLTMGVRHHEALFIEWRNNRLELQSDSNVALIDELDKLLEFLQIPPEFEASLTGGSFDEGNMVKNIEACEWLTSAIKNLEASNLDPIYVKLRAVCINPAELGVLNECLQELLDGVQDDFYALVDWAFKLDPLSCISMHGITDRYLSGQKAEVTGYVHVLLDDLETRITILFSRFVDDACYQIEKYEHNVRQIGVVPHIPRFSQLAARMEQYINGSRDLVDQAYTKIVSIMFVILEKIAQVEPKYVDIVLLENYAAFQHSHTLGYGAISSLECLTFTQNNMKWLLFCTTDCLNKFNMMSSLYDLANVVPTLAKYYHQASEAYEQACSRHINLVIYIHFEKLFQFARKIEELMYSMSPEEVNEIIQFRALSRFLCLLPYNHERASVMSQIHCFLTPFYDMPAWLRTAPAPGWPRSLFELSHGRCRWDPANVEDSTMNSAAFAESQLRLIEAVLGDHAVFHGLGSLVSRGRWRWPRK